MALIDRNIEELQLERKALSDNIEELQLERKALSDEVQLKLLLQFELLRSALSTNSKQFAESASCSSDSATTTTVVCICVKAFFFN